MRTFNLKGEMLVPNPYNADVEPGRTIDAEPLRMTEPGWVQQNYRSGERAVRRECEVEDDERRAAREWLAHMQAGRIGGSTERSDADA